MKQQDTDTGYSLQRIHFSGCGTQMRLLGCTEPHIDSLDDSSAIAAS